jgi:hypothetical protein
MNLVNELFSKTEELNRSISSLKNTGSKFALAEKEYKMIVYEQILVLKDKEKATLINLMIYGIPSVAQKRFERDIAEVMYKANLEHIHSVKLQIKVIQAQLDKEWGKSK